MTGVAKMRLSKLKVQCSCIHSFSACTTTAVAFGSSARRSSRRLARVGHIIARSTPSSSIRTTRSSGLKKAGGDSMYRGGMPGRRGSCFDFVSSPTVVPMECFDEGFLIRNSNSCAPGGATLLKVGFGM